MNAPNLEKNTPEGAATVPVPAVVEVTPPVTLATLAAFWRTLGYAQASITPLGDVLTAMELPCRHCGVHAPWRGLRAVPFYRPGRSALFPGDPRHREPSLRVAMVCRQCNAAEEL